MQTRRIFLAGIGAAALSGCGSRGAFGTAPPSASASVQPMLVATLRKADPAPVAYGAARSDTLDFARLAVSIPPDHATGNIEWPTQNKADATRHFTLTGAGVLPDLEALAAAARSDHAEAVLFVHGYNNNFAEGVYRHAQIAWDYGLKGPQIHFAWPSAGHPLGYAYDHDSVLIARDSLVTLLLRLLRTDQPRLTVVGHSMGGFLVMEALRQIAIQGDRRALDRLEAVVLISPDIDIDVFTAQAAVLAPLPQPFVISVARDDRLLGLASIMTGGQTRLGSLADLEQLGSLGIYVIDLTGTGGRGANHFLPGSSPTAIAFLTGLRDAPLQTSGPIRLGPIRIPLGPTQ